MSRVQMGWVDSRKNVLLQTYIGDISSVELERAIHETTLHLAAGNPPIFIILDFTQLESLPSAAGDTLRQISQPLLDTRLIIVGAHPQAKRVMRYLQPLVAKVDAVENIALAYVRIAEESAASARQ